MKTCKKYSLFYLTSVLLCGMVLTNAYAQNYIAGVSVCDTIDSEMHYVAPCSDDVLSFKVDSLHIPYVTGLAFQMEITAKSGLILSNVADSIRVGDKFVLPAPNESGTLRLSFTRKDDSFSFLIKVLGIPEKGWRDILL